MIDGECDLGQGVTGGVVRFSWLTEKPALPDPE